MGVSPFILSSTNVKRIGHKEPCSTVGLSAFFIPFMLPQWFKSDYAADLDNKTSSVVLYSRGRIRPTFRCLQEGEPDNSKRSFRTAEA